ncbi:MAG: hypothetical protein WC699_04915 [Bacteroidales bacterium]|jgi:hypothetical protein
MEKEIRISSVKVERNTTEIIGEVDFFISACDGISPENIRYAEWGLSICVTVGQRGCEIERIESMRIGDVLMYKGKDDSLFEVRLMAIDTGDNKFAIFEVSTL